MREPRPVMNAQQATELRGPCVEIVPIALRLLAVAFAVVLLTCETARSESDSGEELSVCQNKLKTWEGWAENQPLDAPKDFQTFEDLDQFLKRREKTSLYEELLAENQILRQRNRRLEDLRDVIWPVSPLLVGSAIGFYLLYLAIRRLRKIPISRATKQLFVLIGGAIWVTLGILVNAGQIEYHPASAVSGTFLWSLPGVLLAGILLWWYGQAAQNEANVALQAVAVPASVSQIAPQAEKVSGETATKSNESQVSESGIAGKELHWGGQQPTPEAYLPQNTSTTSSRQRAPERQLATDQEPVEQQETLVYATMWERLKAYICDFAVIFMALGTFIVSGGALENAVFAGTLGLIAYMVLSQWICHTTIGKYLFGLELRSASPNQRYPSFWALLSRETGGRLVSMPFFCAGYWSAIRRPQNQAWSDRIAGTVVVRRTTRPRMRAFLKVVAVVSLLFTIVFYIVYILSLTSRF
jgi:hypothetical protein